MMKRIILTLLTIILLSGIWGSVYGSDDVDDHEGETPVKQIDPVELLQSVDETIFARKGFTENFSEAQGYVNEIIDPKIIHQYYILHGKGNDILMSLLPAEKTVRSGNKRLEITNGWDDEFHVTLYLKRTENIPSGRGGGCWIKYSNSVMKAAGSESGVILYPSERAYYFTPVNGEMNFESIGDLFHLNQDEEIKFDFIRLDGVTYFYADDQFLFSFEDGIVGNVSFSCGSILYSHGNRVHCEFDNFSMTYR